MTATLPTTNRRVTVENGWAVVSHEDGSQTRARLVRDPHRDEPERGDGVWNEGVILVRERDNYGGIDLDEHDGLEHVLERTSEDFGGNVRVETCKPWDPNKIWQDQMTTLGIDREEFVRRYLRAFWGVQHVSLRHHVDYTNWADVWVLVEGVEDGADVDAIADETWREWDAWAKGEVYMVEWQHRTLRDAMDADPEDPDSGWGASDYMGEVYGTGDGNKFLVADALGGRLTDADVPDLWQIVKED